VLYISAYQFVCHISAFNVCVCSPGC
jgi:hypothetical protein